MSEHSKSLRIEPYCCDLDDDGSTYVVTYSLNGFARYTIPCGDNREMAVRLVNGAAAKLIQQVYELGVRDGQKALRDDLKRAIGIE